MVTATVDNTPVLEKMVGYGISDHLRFIDVVNTKTQSPINQKRIIVSDDGTKMLSIDDSLDIIEFNMSTPYDITTISQVDSVTFGDSGSTRNFAPDGQNLYRGAGDTIYHTQLGSPFDITSYTELGSKSFPTVGSITGIGIDSSGTHMVVGDNNTDMYYITLSTPFDITTGKLQHSIKGVSPQATGFQYSESANGNILYAFTSSNLYVFALSAPYNISGMVQIEKLDENEDCGWVVESANKYYTTDVNSYRYREYDVGFGGGYAVGPITVPVGEVWDVDISVDNDTVDIFVDNTSIGGHKNIRLVLDGGTKVEFASQNKMVMSGYKVVE